MTPIAIKKLNLNYNSIKVKNSEYWIECLVWVVIVTLVTYNITYPFYIPIVLIHKYLIITDTIKLLMYCSALYTFKFGFLIKERFIFIRVLKNVITALFLLPIFLISLFFLFSTLVDMSNGAYRLSKPYLRFGQDEIVKEINMENSVVVSLVSNPGAMSSYNYLHIHYKKLPLGFLYLLNKRSISHCNEREIKKINENVVKSEMCGKTVLFEDIN